MGGSWVSHSGPPPYNLPKPSTCHHCLSLLFPPRLPHLTVHLHPLNSIHTVHLDSPSSYKYIFEKSKQILFHCIPLTRKFRTYHGNQCKCLDLCDIPYTHQPSGPPARPGPTSGPPARPDPTRGPAAASIVAFKSNWNKKCSAAAAAAVVSTSPITVPVKQRKNDKPPTTKSCKKQAKRAKNSNPDYYSEVAVALENIYKTSPGAAELGYGAKTQVVRNETSRKSRRVKRRRLGQQKKENSTRDRFRKEEEEEEKLVRGYSGTSSREFASLDWRRMKIPAVIGSTEQAWLFKLMQPMKAIFKVEENMHKILNREAMEGELAAAVNMKVAQLRRHRVVGQAARNKIIKHNLRLVLFAINKHYQELAGSDKLQDLCQAGVKGLITAIDRFEPKRGFRISTYGLFWIRHSITQSMTLSSFIHVSFGIESVRQKIRKARLGLIVELQRLPTEEEIIGRIGISAERYRDVIKASKSVYSLNARHIVTQEEFINGISDDIDGAGVDKIRQSTLLKSALDDVLDSLKPKESMVIRQRYGLDGRGDRTLGEIAGNLNISREMVRKHELKALMKLKNPARLDYLRQYI